jgi:spore maturation protein CgeB
VTFRYVFFGLSITSSWGNGHATTYRALLRALAERGHDITFLERDREWYANNRDLPEPPYARTVLYGSLDELFDVHAPLVRAADVVVVGSFVPEGARVGAWVQELARARTAFYDIDTPVTLEALAREQCEYLTPAQVPRYGLYLSFTGGPTLGYIEREYGAPCARALYCSVDPNEYFPEDLEPRWDLGYLGTYSADRQPALERLLIVPAQRWRRGRFIVAGPQYPKDFPWPQNVAQKVHLAPPVHRRFYNEQRCTLNVTRKAMARAGWSPSVRLFEAGACGTPIVTDPWPGLEEILEPGREVLVCDTAEQVLAIVRDLPEVELRRVATAARKRILAEHAAMDRAEALERYTCELLERASKRSRVVLEVTP